SEEETAFETPGGSFYSPSLDATLDITCMLAPRARSRIAVREGSSPLENMNQFLESKDVSPVRYPVSVPWSEASNRTRRHHVRKSRQAVGAVLEEIAPQQSAHLWKTLVSFKSLQAQDSSSDTEDVPPSLAGQVKGDGVSTVANVEYGNTYIRVWKA
ncbi:unnamed protein product, partial [Porites evermanni]